jgi:arsenate reductase (thioredoxin)
MDGTRRSDGTPAVVFLCVRNAGRSQMALGWTRALGGDHVEVRSGGSEPVAQIDPVAVAAMAEVGIDIGSEHPKSWIEEEIAAADVVVTMGCGDTCPVIPGRRYEDWEIEDPAGQALDAVRPIRDEIERRVRILLDQLAPTGALRTLVSTGADTRRRARTTYRPRVSERWARGWSTRVGAARRIVLKPRDGPATI